LKRGDAYALLEEPDKAMADYSWGLQLMPGGATRQLSRTRALQFNNLAWAWATVSKQPDEGPKALVLATKAVEIAPHVWTYHNTLGVVHYRLEHYREALVHLERSLRGNAEQTAAFDLFFMAMCHHRLGDDSQARDCFNKAVQWMNDRKGRIRTDWLTELGMFRSESAELLGLPTHP
jgi:tetratricopeptide (TPR) repeat protein